jgi:hypothetical protein
MSESRAAAQTKVNQEVLNSLTVTGDEATTSTIKLVADEGDDAGDKWNISVANGAASDAGALTINTEVSGSSVPVLTIDPAATAADSTTTVAGALAVTGTSTASDTAFLRGYASTKPSIITKWPAHTDSSATDHTVTIAQVLTGILEADPAADRTWTLPSAALAVAGVTGVAVGDSIDFSVINSGTAAADEIITIAMGSGGTAVGYMGVKCAGVAVGDSEGSGLFRIRFTNVTGSSEAYTVYRVA